MLIKRVGEAFLAALVVASGAGAQTYKVTGGIDHASSPADFTQSYDSGVSATGAQLSASHSSPDNLGSATFTGSAHANSLRVFASSASSGSLLSHANAGVFATLTDSVRFDGGADGYVAVRATIFLHDGLALDEQPASASALLSFNPAGNTAYFNTGLTAYDRLDGSGRQGVLASSTVYYVPNGDALNFQLQLQASAITSFGYDFARDIPLANIATADASNTGFLNFRVLTPGGFFTAASGADYTTLQDGVGGVPEPASWTLLIAGFAVTGVALRRRGVVTAS